MSEEKITISFRASSPLYSDFKKFCSRNKVTVKHTFTKLMELFVYCNKDEKGGYND